MRGVYQLVHRGRHHQGQIFQSSIGSNLSESTSLIPLLRRILKDAVIPALVYSSRCAEASPPEPPQMVGTQGPDELCRLGGHEICTEVRRR